MGLLNALQSDEALLGMHLLAAGAAKPVRTSFGEGLLGATQAVAQRKAQRAEMEAREEERRQRAQYQAMQMQAMMEAAAGRKRAQENEEKFRGMITSPQMQSVQGALAGGGGPTVANAAQIKPVDPNQQLMFEAMRLGQIKPLDYIAAQSKDTTPMSVPEGAALYDPRTGREVFKNAKAEKPDKQPTSVEEFLYAQQNPQFMQHMKEMANLRTPKTNVTVPVNLGQRGFDNTLKLRGDFRSEPVYKAHQEMQSAYSQIQQSLKQASPAGDLAGATKIMKLLDPGSVVRESELGMAMAASGLMDSVTNYANLIMTGQKLTPTQRADFQRLADALFAESVKQYNNKRGEYQGIAERNQLSVPDVLGAPSVVPTSKVVNFGDLK